MSPGRVFVKIFNKILIKVIDGTVRTNAFDVEVCSAVSSGAFDVEARMAISLDVFDVEARTDTSSDVFDRPQRNTPMARIHWRENTPLPEKHAQHATKPTTWT